MQFCRIFPIAIGKTVWIVFSIIFPYFPLLFSLSFTFIQDFKEFDTSQGLASFCLQLLTTLYMMLAVQLGGVCKKTKNGKSWWRMVSASFCVYKSATFVPVLFSAASTLSFQVFSSTTHSPSFWNLLGCLKWLIKK